MTRAADKSAQPVLLGRVSGVFGVEGWVKLYSYTEPREAILGYEDCLLLQDGAWQALRWQRGKRHGKTVIARIEGVDDRDAAENLVGADIGIWREDLPEAGGESFYWADLEGLTVVNTDGDTLGVVASLMATGANDVLVVKGDREILIPFVTGQYVLGVDLADGVIRVDWEWE